MSIFRSVVGSLSPKFRSSFEDPNEREHELPFYSSRSPSPRIPPPITSSVLWNATSMSPSPLPRIPDDLLAIQRRARYLQQRLQELLDAQADGLARGPAEDDQTSEDGASDGTATPTVSSLQERGRSSESSARGSPHRTKPIGANAVRQRIFKRIQQLAQVKAEENEYLEEDRRELQTILDKTLIWSQKRARLQGKIRDIQGEDVDERARTLQGEASKLESEIRLKEEELRILKARHRHVLDELADSENSHEAKLASYETSLSILDKEIVRFLKKPPKSRHVPLSSSPFLTLPPNRRTLDMAQEYWRDEITRLEERSDDADRERAALDEGAVLWDDVITKVIELETSVVDQLRQTKILDSETYSRFETTINHLENKLDVATSRSWKLLICAIGAELETLYQGKKQLERIGLGTGRKGEEKESDLVDTDTPPKLGNKGTESSPIRELNRSPPKSSALSAPRFLDMHDDDPDPELIISR